MNLILILLITLVLGSCEGEAPVLGTNPYSSNGDNSAGGSPSSFDYGKGARFGPDNLLSAMDSCTEKGKFFDRVLVDSLPDEATESQYSAGCTSLTLAKIDCTKEGVISHTEAKSKDESFTKKVKDNIQGLTLGGFEVDQCLICLKGSEEDLCQTGTDERKPPPIDIISIYFVNSLEKTQSIPTLLN